MNFPKLFLKPGKERSLQNLHPWLFSGAVASADTGIKEGDIVEVYTNDKRYIATGHFHEGSIKVRIFSFEQVVPDASFWKRKISDAYQLRIRLGLVNNATTNVYRLIHAEGDGMPGLIIDVYNDTA